MNILITFLLKVLFGPGRVAQLVRLWVMKANTKIN